MHPAKAIFALAVAAFVFTATLHAQPSFPAQLPPIPTPAGNPITPPKALLGMALFFEEQLSSTGAVACATCHPLEHGGADDRARPNPGPDLLVGTADDRHGSPGVILQAANGGYVPAGLYPFARQVTPRRAPSVINAAFSTQQFLDGRAGPEFVDPVSGAMVFPTAAGLEAQVAETALSDVEMAHLGETWPNIVSRLRGVRPLALATDLPLPLAAFVGDGSAGYALLFQSAFGSPHITPARVAMAIATYMRTLVSDGAPIDAFLAGDANALTSQERNGFTVFATIGGCTTCHTPPLFTLPDAFIRTGVRPAVEDIGRAAVTAPGADSGAFKVPSLRNVGLRGPFFHNGGKATLADVVDFYDVGGDVPSPFLFPLNLSAQQKADLLAFLGRPLTDPRVANQLPPFDRPTLWSENTSRRATVVAPGSRAPGTVAPRFVLEEPAYGNSDDWTIALTGAPAGVPGALLVGASTSGPFVVGNVSLHVFPGPNSLVLPLPPTVAGGIGIAGDVRGVVSTTLPIPDTQGLEFPVVMQAVFPDPANSVFVASPAVSVPLFSQRGT